MINESAVQNQNLVSSAHLQTLLTDLENVNQETTAILSRYSDTQLTWKPAPTEWSMAECFDHLIVTGNQYYPRIQRAIEQTRQKGLQETRPFQASWFGKKFIGMLEPDSGRKVKTFKVFEPSNSPDPTVGQKFLDQQPMLTDLIRQADGYDLNRIKLTSPVTWLIRFSIGEALWLQVVHQRLHMKQIQEVTQFPGFPEA